MDIGGWLRSLGLEKYEAAFRENDVNRLPNLTPEWSAPLELDSFMRRF